MTSVAPLRKPLGAQPPLKPILRSDPAVTLSAPKKRAMEDADEPESPSKRQKNVHFDDTLRTIDPTGRSLEETKREVRKALERFSRGEKEDYNDLKAIFTNDAEASDAGDQADTEDIMSSEDLVVYVIALTQCAHMLNRSCSTLIKAILQCRWLGRTELFASAYAQFMAALISANGACLEPVLTMIVEKFRDSSPRSWNVAGAPAIDKETVRRRLHSSLQYLLKLFPAARPLLCKLISQKFPFSEESERVHLAYVQNLIRLKDYTDLGADITEIITSRLVKLDVEFQLDLDDMDDDLVPSVIMHLQAAQEADQEADDSDAESDVSDEEEEDETTQRIEKSALLVKKLDSMLDAMFELYAPIFANPDTEEAREYFANMFSDFTNFVLPTHKSRHTQFLIFHYSQQSASLTDAFVGSLFDIAFESNRPAAIRQAAVAYLGSFVARGAHVSTELVRNIMRVLCHHIDKFRVNYGANCRGASLQRYHTLYSWVQAAMYIFCFKYRDLIDAVPDLVDRDDVSTYLGQEMEWMEGLKESMRSIIYSPFNPLKVCSPPLVEEFAKIASHLRFLYLFPKIENNKKIHLAAFVSGAYSNGGALRDVGYDPHDEAWLQLEDNFPFDPYQLPVSKRWLEGDYNNWTPIPGLDEDDDDEAEKDDTQSQRQMTEEAEDAEEEYEEDATTDEELALPAWVM